MCAHVPSVVSFAIWERVGPGAGQVAEEKDTGYLWLNRRLCNVASILWNPLDYNYAVDYTAIRRLKNAQKEYEELHWSACPTRWHLRAVVTHTSWRGFGMGGQLINWGMQRAHDEGIVAAVETTPEGEHCEELFVRLKWARRSTFLPTVGGVDMGTAMMFIPPTLQTRLLLQLVGKKEDVKREDVKWKVTDARSAAEIHASRLQKEFPIKGVSNGYNGRAVRGTGLKENKEKVIKDKLLEVPGGWA